MNPNINKVTDKNFNRLKLSGLKEIPLRNPQEMAKIAAFKQKERPLGRTRADPRQEHGNPKSVL